MDFWRCSHNSCFENLIWNLSIQITFGMHGLLEEIANGMELYLAACNSRD